MKLHRETLLVQVLGVILLVLTIWFVASFPFDVPNKIAVSFILGILLYAIFEYSFLPEIRSAIKTKFQVRIDKHSRYIFVLIYSLSLVLVALPISVSNYSLYIPWATLSSLSLAKLFASILLTSFLPGYIFLKIITYNSKARVFSNIGVGVLSVLLSFFITIFTTCFHWAIERGFKALNCTLFFSYTMFLALFVILSFLKREKLKENEEPSVAISSSQFYNVLILLCVIAFLMWVFCSTHFVPYTMHILHDELRHTGLTLQLFRGWQPWQDAEVGSSSYPYFFNLILIAAMSLSNVPLLTVYLSFFFLLILPAFALYFMVQMIFGNKRDIPLFAMVIFSVFSGFGWVYANSLQRSIVGTSEISTIIQASQTTYDIIYSTWLPIYIAPYTVDLAIFFVLIGLIGHKRIGTKSLFIPVVVLATLGSLVHVEKIVILGFFLFILSLLYVLRVKFINHPKTILSAYIIGLLLSYAVDFFTPYRIGREYLPIILNVFLICATGLILIALGERFGKKIHGLSSKINTRHLKYAFDYIALSLYLILSLAFFYSFSSYSFSQQSVPLWFLPLKMGVAGLLSLPGLFYSVRERSRVNFFVTLCVATLLIELLLYHLPFSSVSVSFPEFRVVRDVLWAFLSVVAAYGMKKLIETSKTNLSSNMPLLKYFVVCLLFFVIFAGGIPSHLLKVEYFASVQRVVSAEEMDALNYLSSLEIPSGSFILTGFSKDEVYAATGAQTYGLGDQVYEPLIFNSKSPGTTLYVLHYLNISHTYFSSQDLHFLENKYGDSFFMWLTSYLYPLFRNNATIIYRTPHFSPPLDESNVAVVTSDLLTYAPTLTKNFVWIDDSFTEDWTEVTANNVEYRNFTSDGDVATLEAKTIVEQQAAVFYVNDFKEHITTSADTVAIIKFKSNTATSYAILDTLYSDGSTQRLLLENNGYMKSLEWITVTNFLQPNKTVKAVRVGITDNKEGNGGTIGASFDYIAITKTGKLTDYYTPPLLSALMQINYTTISEFDPSLLDYNTLFISDLELTNKTASQYVNWVRNGGTLIVINSQERGTLSNFLGIKESGKYLSSNFIVSNEGPSVKIPSLTIPELELNDASTKIIANYAFDNTTASPFALLKKLEEGKIMYLETTPLLRNFGGSQDLIKTIDWIRDLLQTHVSFSLFNTETYRRTFYVKNIGEVSSQGETHITTPSIVSRFEKLSGVTLSFSNYNQAGNGGSFLENVVISDVELNGTIPATINVDGNITILPLDSNNYVRLKLNGETLFKFNVTHSNEIKVTLKSGNHTDLLFHDGVLLIRIPHADNLEVIARNPMITNNGTTTFDSLFALYPYEFQSAGDRGTLNGYIEFKVKLSEESVSLLDKVQLNGDLRLDVTTSSAFNDDLNFFINFPQESAFFALVIILITIIVYMKTRKTSEVDA